MGADDYYRPNHGENKEAGCISDALDVLEVDYARTVAEDTSARYRDVTYLATSRTPFPAMVSSAWATLMHDAIAGQGGEVLRAEGLPFTALGR